MNKAEMNTLKNKVDLLKKLEQMDIKTHFKARDIEVSGATLRWARDSGLINIVGTETVLYPVGEDSMREGSIYIYKKVKNPTKEIKKRMDPTNLVEPIFSREIASEMRQIAYSLRRIDEMLAYYEDLFK